MFQPFYLLTVQISTLTSVQVSMSLQAFLFGLTRSASQCPQVSKTRVFRVLCEPLWPKLAVLNFV